MTKGNRAGCLAIFGLGVCIMLGLMFNGIAQQPTQIAAGNDPQKVLASRIAVLEAQVQDLTVRLAALEEQAGISVAPTSQPTKAPVKPGAIVTSTPAPATAPYGVESLTTQGSNIRSGPGTDYAVMRTVPANAPLDIIGYNDDSGKVWYVLQDGGWISGSLVKNPPSGVVYKSAPPPPAPPPLADTPVVIAATPTNCHASYDPCVRIASDADCASGSGNGPVYVEGPVRVIGPDDYDLDRDGDGFGCE